MSEDYFEWNVNANCKYLNNKANIKK